MPATSLCGVRLRQLATDNTLFYFMCAVVQVVWLFIYWIGIVAFTRPQTCEPGIKSSGQQWGAVFACLALFIAQAVITVAATLLTMRGGCWVRLCVEGVEASPCAQKWALTAAMPSPARFPPLCSAPPGRPPSPTSEPHPRPPQARRLSQVPRGGGWSASPTSFWPPSRSMLAWWPGPTGWCGRATAPAGHPTTAPCQLLSSLEPGARCWAKCERCIRGRVWGGGWAACLRGREGAAPGPRSAAVPAGWGCMPGKARLLPRLARSPIKPVLHAVASPSGDNSFGCPAAVLPSPLALKHQLRHQLPCPLRLPCSVGIAISYNQLGDVVRGNGWHAATRTGASALLHRLASWRAQHRRVAGPAVTMLGPVVCPRAGSLGMAPRHNFLPLWAALGPWSQHREAHVSFLLLLLPNMASPQGPKGHARRDCDPAAAADGRH